MSDRIPLDVAGVARELGHSPTWFTRHRKELEKKHAFPPPLPGLGNRWDPLAIKLWKDRCLPAHLRPETRIEHAGVELAIQLDTRAEQLAARH